MFMECFITGRDRVRVDSSMGNDSKTVIFDDIQSAADYIIDCWSQTALSAVRLRGFFSVALSGGKTPIVLYDRLCLSEKPFVWDKTHIFFADERFVPENSPESNYHLVVHHLLCRAGVSPGNVHRVITRDLSLAEAARKYDKELWEFFKHGVPRFDLIVLGVGADGHTASLFPGINDHREVRRRAIPVIAESVPSERISLTLQVINNARHVIMFAAGRSKAKIILEVVEQRNTALPAARIVPREGKLTYVLDAEAASLLEQSDAGNRRFDP